MSEQPSTLNPTVKASLKPNQAYLSGRIVSMRKVNTQEGMLHLTLMRLAAPDQFSHPATVEVRSYEPLGDNDSDWNGAVRLSGIPNSYKSKKTDPRTGEEIETTVRTARNEYTVIEK